MRTHALIAAPIEVITLAIAERERIGDDAGIADRTPRVAIGVLRRGDV
jgi:hypothetical protein